MPLLPLRSRLLASDYGWCLAANRLAARRVVRAYFRTVSRLGDGAFWYALLVAMTLIDGAEGLKASLHVAATGTVALGLYRWLKRWTRRPRPFAADARIRAWTAPLDEFSFPSGHTLHAVTLTLVTLAHYPASGWVLLPFTASVAASRVFLGLHYPSDVLAATAIGVALAALSIRLAPGVSLLGWG